MFKLHAIPYVVMKNLDKQIEVKLANIYFQYLYLYFILTNYSFMYR